MPLKVATLHPWSTTQADGTIIRNCKIHDSEIYYRDSTNTLWSYGQGIFCGAGKNQNYTSNRIYNISSTNTRNNRASAHGIYVGYRFSDSVIRFNYIHNCPAGNCIHVYSDYPNPKYALFTNIKIYGNVLRA